MIEANKIRVYIAEKSLIDVDGGARKTSCQTLIPARIDQESGIEARTFDTTIDEMNQIQEAIIFSGEENDCLKLNHCLKNFLPTTFMYRPSLSMAVIV